MSIAEKLKILDLLKSGERVGTIARRLNVNESTIRSIRDNEERLRGSAAQLGVHAKVTKISRNVNIEKMEEMLIIWIQDLIEKKVPLGV